MNNAVIAQEGSPKDLYNFPRNKFVANFIGDANVVKAEVINKNSNSYDIKIAEMNIKIQNDNELRPVAPFVELTLGNYFVGQPGYFSSVNVTIPQNSSWEIEPGYELTHMADVTIEFTYIGKRLPRLTGKQYDIDYEQDVSRTREVERIVSERLEAQKKKEEESRKLNFDTTLNVNAGVTGGQRTQGFGTALGGTPGVISPLPTSLGGDD